VKLRIIVLAITLELVWYLLSFFLSAGKDVIHPAKPPALLDALLPEQSPLTIVQQYQASLLLGGDNPRLMLIFRKMQCSSLAQMCAEFPDALRLIRRSVLLTSAWMYRRHQKPLHEAPWLLCTLADERATEMQKQLVCDVWDQKQPC
jgi:hypothetical protein